ncbi:MAG: helix-hairpin-helix domain-containing protein [Beijerinckiaceae bacterium]|nr:helix-hairpin-helix domain-containing protein [Beijerinckiaceae bacterium]
MHKRFLAALFIATVFAGSVSAQGPATAPTTKPAVTAPATPPSISPPAATTPAKPAALMDINSASLTELQTLKGVGAVRAEATVKGRPYKGKDDLLARKIVPANVYNDIKDGIVARQKN